MIMPIMVLSEPVRKVMNYALLQAAEKLYMVI